MQAAAGPDGMPLLEGLRLLSGFQPGAAADPEAEVARSEWSHVIAGGELKKLLDEMQTPEVSAESDPGPGLLAQLRPYQRQGAHWLWFMNKLGLGACLADDMGLGKTIQVISLLLVLKRRNNGLGQRRGQCPQPADRASFAHRQLESRNIEVRALVSGCFMRIRRRLRANTLRPLPKIRPGHWPAHDLVITSYSMACAWPGSRKRSWNVVVLDEAQAIKNAGSRQSRAVKELRSRHRIALSGTPIENRLSDLWSLFDFICPGLLGGAKEFAAFMKSRSQEDPNQFAPLRRLVRPYILRRLKTDKRIISDLPEKTEMAAFCPLTRRQAALYQQSVNELAERLGSPGNRRHPAARHHPGVPDPIQTNLQSSLAMARRRGIRSGRQRQVPSAARIVRGNRRPNRRKFWCSPNTARSPTRWRAIWQAVFGQAGAGAARRHAGGQAQGIGG